MTINSRFIIRLAAGLVVLSLSAAPPLPAQDIKDPGVLQARADELPHERFVLREHQRNADFTERFVGCQAGLIPPGCGPRSQLR